jgi:lactoylglutathione lyase
LDCFIEVVMQMNGVRELRLVVTAENYDQALHFYRDVLGLKERAAFASEGGHVTILEAGQATLELTDPGHAEFIDKVEVGYRVAGHIRVAFEVDDSAASTRALEAAGAKGAGPANTNSVELVERPIAGAGRSSVDALQRNRWATRVTPGGCTHNDLACPTG